MKHKLVQIVAVAGVIASVVASPAVLAVLPPKWSAVASAVAGGVALIAKSVVGSDKQ